MDPGFPGTPLVRRSPTSTVSAARAISNAWAPPSRRKVPWPGPPSSPAWTPAATASSISCIATPPPCRRSPPWARPWNPDTQLRLGPYVLPLSAGEVRSFRQGKAFWQILARTRNPHHHPAHARELPTRPLRCQELSGMGTPDLHGTFGTFTFFTDDPVAAQPDRCRAAASCA